MSFPHIDPQLEHILQFMERGIPFNRQVGIEGHHLTRGHCVLRVEPSDDLTGDPFRPAVHGGVISTLVDTAGGAACFTMLGDPRDRVSTVDLRVDYLRPGPCGVPLFCEARVVRMGNRVAVARMEVFAHSCPGPDDPRPEPIATGQAVYNVVRKSGREEEMP